MDLWLGNVLAHAAQALTLVLGAALVERALRTSHPVSRMTLWRTILGLIVILPVVQPWHASVQISESVGTRAALEVSNGGAAASIHAPDWAGALMVLLVAGAVARLARIGLGLARLRRLRAEARPEVLPGAVLEAMDDLRVSADVRIAEAAGPVSFGVLNPVVIFPRRFLEQNERSQYLIACHELLHVRRRDALNTLGEEIIFALLWYQPWLWYLRARLRLAREQVVDLAVTRDRARRDPYVWSLLVMTGHRVPGLADAAAPRGRELRVRIEALYREVSMSRTRLAIVGTVIVIAAAALAVVGAATFPLNGAPVIPPPVADTAQLTAAAPFVSPLPPPRKVARQQQEDDIVTVGGDIQPPRKIKHVTPVYPEAAREAGIEGVVILEAVIGRDGLVKRADVVRSIPELDGAAIEAVVQWEFEPTYVKGKAVSVRMTVTINFTLA